MENDFTKIMTNHSDDKLIEILQNRKNYQPVAVEAAIDQALQRKIILNLEDLEAKYPFGNVVTYQNNSFLHEDINQRKAEANKDMIYGALWCVGGIIATSANIVFIFWGAIVFGGIQFFKGLSNS